MSLIYITGAASCGKSTPANTMADNADILSLDAVFIKNLFCF